MVQKVTKQHSKGEVLALLEPLVRTWFDRSFPGLTEPQAFAVPLIHAGESVLISSPTGSGKTLTAFLSIINELYSLQLKGELEDRIYAVYVSPLKALANDINRNLTTPLEEMRQLAAAEGFVPPEIRVAVRSGDTSPAERQKQAKRPPHIFITTPESLTLVLTAPKFREAFAGVRWMIVDEIHEVCSSKRGALLSLSLERLQAYVGRAFTRIGLSATIAPIDEIAKFLVGYDDGRMRPVQIVEVESRKSLDLAVLCPVRDLTQYALEEANARMYDVLSTLIDEHRTTLIFTNTRSGTEHVSFKLKERGVENLEAHHGSLSKETRLDVEERLKRGELKAAVSSTSLELGIDIGYIDLVVQIGSPKSIAKGLQRIGRAGHKYGDTSVGRLVVFEPWDLMECATLVKNAYENRIDRVGIPRNCLDVLAQAVIGMSLEARWDVDEAFALIRRSYAYHELPKKDFLAVLDYLSSRNPDIKVFAKIWYDEEERRFGKKRGTRLIYFTNVGTIPEEGTYHVFSERGTPLGELSEHFVEYLHAGDIFVLGGRTYQFVRARGMAVYVKDASGRRPTVPSWTGEMLPRSFDLSLAVGAFRREIADAVDRDGEEAAIAWLTDTNHVDQGSARSLVSYIQEQRAMLPDLPTDRRLLLEGYIDPKGNRNVIFHFPFGRRVNDALSRAYAFAVTDRYKTNVRVSVTDDNFMLTVPKRLPLEGLASLVTADTLEDLLRRAVRTTELFKQRFRHCATRAFMVLRNYKGREVSIGRQQLRSQRIIDFLHQIEDFPVVKEAYNEIMNEVMDVRNARQVLEWIQSGRLEVALSDYAALPSPFAHNAVLAGISDLVLMEDRSALLRELHRQVLKRVLPQGEIEKAQFTEEEIRAYFRAKLPKVSRAEDVVDLLALVGDLNLVQQKGRSAFDHASAPFAQVRKWSEALMREGKVASVWTPKGVTWARPEDVPLYAAVYAQKSRLKPEEERVVGALATGPSTPRDLARALAMDRESLTELLRRLERAYVVHRTGVEETRFAVREVKRADFEQALDALLARRLGADGPKTLHELAYDLDVEDDLVRETLRDMEQEGVVASGHFVLGEDFQYLLARDLQNLQRKGETRPMFDEAQVRAFLMGKQFRGLRTIDDYFDRFLEAGLVFDVFNHVEGFDHDAWTRRREEGEILEGRFLNGRVRYVRRPDVPLFLSAFPRDPLTELEAKVFEAIRAHPGGLDLYGVAAEVEGDRQQVREALEKLDYDCYVIRKFQGDAWATRNLYVAFDEPDDAVPDALDTLLLRYLRAYGPTPLSGMREYARLRWDQAESLVDRLERAGKIVRILVTGRAEGEMILLADELEPLRGAEPVASKDRVRVLSLLDAWVQPLWAQVAAKWGEGWLFPIVKDGELVGVAEKWEMSGALEIREIDLASSDLIPETLEAIDRMMDFYRARGFEVVRITRAFGKPVPEIDVRPFLAAGYGHFGDFLAKGEIDTRQFEKGQILAVVFARQGLHPDRPFPDLVEAAASLGGLRSDFAARLRVREFVPLERLHRRGALTKGLAIPEYWTYTTEGDLRLFKRAKQVPVTKEMKEILSIVRTEEPVSRSRLLALSPLGRATTTRLLKDLYAGIHVTRDADNKYCTVKDPQVSPAEARKEVMRRIVRSFGIFSAEGLSTYTRFEYNMAEIRRLLREMERDGDLVKGFFVRGERTLYWMTPDALEAADEADFSRSFVLTPLDNLSLYLRDEIARQWRMGSCWVVFDGTTMVAAFRANRRKNRIVIKDFEGDSAARRIVETFEEENELSVGEHVERISDAEVLDWYSKMYGRVGK